MASTRPTDPRQHKPLGNPSSDEPLVFKQQHEGPCIRESNPSALCVPGEAGSEPFISSQHRKKIIAWGVDILDPFHCRCACARLFSLRFEPRNNASGFLIDVEHDGPFKMKSHLQVHKPHLNAKEYRHINQSIELFKSSQTYAVFTIL